MCRRVSLARAGGARRERVIDAGLPTGLGGGPVMHRWAKARTGQNFFRPVSGAENAAAFRGSIPKYFCPFLRKTAWIIPWKMHAPSDTHLLASWLEVGVRGCVH